MRFRNDIIVAVGLFVTVLFAQPLFAGAANYRSAAEQGNADAQYLLGNCYIGGLGVEKDKVEAVKWFSKAAAQGNVKAQKILDAK